MTIYTDTEGKHTLLCDHCRCDMPQGSAAFTLAPGKVGDGYVSRDYDKGEMTICQPCAEVIGQLIPRIGIKQADRLCIAQEAA